MRVQQGRQKISGRVEAHGLRVLPEGVAGEGAREIRSAGASKKKDAPASPRIEAIAPDVAIDELELHVKDEVVELCGNQPVRRKEEPSPRHRAGVASMAWRTTRRFSTNAP